MNDKKCNSGFNKDNWPARNDCPNWHECDDGFYCFCMCNIIEKARADEKQKIIKLIETLEIDAYDSQSLRKYRAMYELGWIDFKKVIINKLAQSEDKTK